MPEEELLNSSGSDGVEAKCQLCNEAFTAHRYLYTHLSDNHFKQELDNDLPKSAPWKCPSCKYVGNDPRALRIHYGVRHKVVLQHLASRIGVSANILKKQGRILKELLFKSMLDSQGSWLT